MNKDELAKEVFAHYGLAMYLSQVLEHGIVNALILIDFVPSNMHKYRHRSIWDKHFDEFFTQHFKTTLGKMLNNLKKHITIEKDFEEILNKALEVRNYLAHHYFRDRSEIFLTESGCNQMIEELQKFQQNLRDADEFLESKTRHYRIALGITDEKIKVYMQQMKDEQSLKAAQKLNKVFTDSNK